MADIGVRAEVLRSRSQDFNNKSSELGDMIAQLTNLVNALESDWQGQAASSFVQQWNDLKPSMDKASQLLGDIGVQLDQTATAFESFDAEVASKYGV